MANKVIQLSPARSTSQQDAASSGKSDVYVDIDVVACKTSKRQPSPQDEDEYLAALLEEHGSAEEAFYYICSEESKEYPEEDKEFLRLQYAKKQDYEQVLRIYYKYSQMNVGKLTDVNAVKNSIHQIFTWIPGERILLPEFGSDLRKLLYEGITPFNVERIIAEIRHCVSEWEPRVEIQKVVNMSNVDDTEDNTVHIEVLYTIPGLTGSQLHSEPIVYSRG